MSRVDFDWEFNAPHWFDFSKIGDASSISDDWFDERRSSVGGIERKSSRIPVKRTASKIHISVRACTKQIRKTGSSTGIPVKLSHRQ